MFYRCHAGVQHGTVMGVRSRLLLATAAALLALWVSWSPAAASAEQPHVRPDGHVVLAWLHGGSSKTYREQVAPLAGVTVVTPTWWSLDTGDPGALIDRADPDFAAWARRKGLAVWPQLSNRLDTALSHAALTDKARSARLVRQTTAAVERAGADGVVIAFDNLREDTGPALTAFVARLAAALPGRTVAVTVAAQTAGWSRGASSAAYERRELAEVADYLILQALDQHHDASRPGPVAGLEWTQDAVDQLVRVVPERSVILSVPLYARDWVEDPHAPGGSRLHDAQGMTAMQRRLDDAGAAHTVDADAGQRRYTYTDEAGRRHAVWQEDAASVGRRADVATSYNLAGVAAWRAGLGPVEAWEAISAALAADPRPSGPASGPPRLNPLVPAPQLAPPRVDATADTVAARRPRPPALQGDGTSVPVAAASLLLVLVVAGHVRLWARRPVPPQGS